MTAIPFPVGKGESEVVERRSSAWADPRTWVSIVAILLTLSIFIGGLIINQLSSLNAKVEGLTVAAARQGSDYDAMKAKQASDNELLKEQLRSVQMDIKALQEHDAGQERTISEIRGATVKRGR